MDFVNYQSVECQTEPVKYQIELVECQEISDIGEEIFTGVSRNRKVTIGREGK